MRLKIVRRSVLKSIVRELKEQGKRVVFTNGCFDILHIGHLRYLQEARELGDCLIVALNTDDSVRQLKGPERPFVPEFERAEIMAALACVDYVTIFSEQTAVEIVRELQPSVFVKGGDYTPDVLPETPAVQAYGGEVVILDKVEGKSTSNIVTQIRTAASNGNSANEGKAIGIIPSRLAATRLPNKPLLDIAGKPMIQRVCERASGCGLLDDIIVATPDEEIRKCVESFGYKVEMTSPNHRSGTDRLAEAARRLEADIVINIQGDEPLLDPCAVDALVKMMQEHPDVPMGSLMCPITSEEEWESPSVVKVVTDQEGYALYFSRSRVPYPRCDEAVRAMKHIGVYAYRYPFLLRYSAMEPTPLEKAESLEQLRVLEHGYKIMMVETSFSPTSVDTPEDLERVRQLYHEDK